MHQTWRLTRTYALRAMMFGALAVLALIGSRAQAATGTVDNGGVKRYVLMATETWGAAQNAAVEASHGTVEFSHGASGLGVASSDNPIFLRRVMRSDAFSRGAEDMNVQWQEPANVQPADYDVGEEAVTPGDDTFINFLWNMAAIEAPGAWSAGYDGSGVRVAVIDGGICSQHPDVAPNIDVAASRSFVPGQAFDDETGGPGGFRHACHVAGIIAAADNSIGTIGVAPHATIIACKALHDGSGTFAAVIEAILYASDPIAAGGAGANIINMSLGAVFPRGGGNTGAGILVAAMNQAVNYATAHNVLVVSAAGNNGLDLDHSGSLVAVPAQSGSGIAVSATAPVDWAGGATNVRDPAPYSNYGHSAIWVAAPGGDFAYPGNEDCSVSTVSPPGSVVRPCWVFDGVLSPGNQNGGYYWAFGTSMAAPHVAGVAALIVQKNPGISVGDLKTQLAQTADDEGEIGADPHYGHGFVNARRAVTESSAMATQTDLAGGATEPAGSQAEFVITGNGTRGIPTMSFTLSNAGRANLSLYDIAGRKVAVLFDGEAAAGRTTLSWDGRGMDGKSLRQGAYFARFDAGGVQQGRRIVLLGQ